MLSEVLFKVGRTGFAPAQHTADDPTARIVLSYPTFEPAEGHLSGVYTLHAQGDRLEELAHAVEAAYPRHDLVDASAPFPTYLVHVDRAQGDGSGPPEGFALGAFPSGTVLGPGLMEDGALHLRAVVPGAVDLERLMDARDRGLRSGALTDFQLERTGAFEAARAATGALAATMTPKQLEVLRSAVALGYYESPRKVTLDDLAEVFGISKAAIHNRLQAAERKIVTAYLQ